MENLDLASKIKTILGNFTELGELALYIFSLGFFILGVWTMARAMMRAYEISGGRGMEARDRGRMIKDMLIATFLLNGVYLAVSFGNTIFDGVGWENTGEMMGYSVMGYSLNDGFYKEVAQGVHLLLIVVGQLIVFAGLWHLYKCMRGVLDSTAWVGGCVKVTVGFCLAKWGANTVFWTLEVLTGYTVIA